MGAFVGRLKWPRLNSSKDDLCGCRETSDSEVRWGLQFFCIAPVEEDGATTGIRAAIHIAPAVANHPALGEVKMECFGRAVQHAGRGLTKFGGRVPVAWLITNLDVRDFRNRF